MNSMNYDQNERIRRAAILVASIDESLAEQMLDSLPPSEATKILAEYDRLGEIDPDEQRDVLAEFRRAGRREAEPSSGVEFTYSAPQPAMSVEPVAPAVQLPTPAEEAAAAAEASLVAELLNAEHPQTIAVALSRMAHERGAAVFAQLASALQGEVFERLTNLQITDESAVAELEMELQQRIELQRQRRERAAAGAEMARRIVAKTPPSQRDSLLARIAPPQTPSIQPISASAVATPALTEQQTRELELAIQQARELVAAQDEMLDEEGGFEAWTDGPEYGDEAEVAFDPALLEDRSRDLERLNDAALLRALQAADERTVQLALACSSEKFLRRVAAKLPRAAAARLRMAVRSIGPTRLIELRAAQHELLNLAAHAAHKVAA
jgi:flagellar motor switch protein FliG